MPTPHIEATKGQIAEIVLLPGDPLRAKYIAENFLTDCFCFNRVRNMLGYTGNHQNKKISVMGTGMGIPSASIYIHELINEYGAKNLIRIGSAGALQRQVKIRDLVIALSASTNTKINRTTFHDQDYAPTVSPTLLLKAYTAAKEKKLLPHYGNVISSDLFYDENQEGIQPFINHGVLAVEMETAALYTLAARFKVEALAILSISDHLLETEQKLSPKERENSFNAMIELALATTLLI